MRAPRRFSNSPRWDGKKSRREETPEELETRKRLADEANADLKAAIEKLKGK